VDGVVAEVLEHPVLDRQEVQRRSVGGEVLGDRVLWDVQRVALLDLVPSRFLGRLDSPVAGGITVDLSAKVHERIHP
jgi:hypothetical protein